MINTHEMDFWGLETDNRRVGVVHREPVANDQNPRFTPTFRSLKDGVLYKALEYCPPTFLEDWRNACGNTNVYRTLRLYDDKGAPILLWPFLIDIDNSDEDLDDALAVAKATVEILKSQLGIREHDMRVFFSGRKGFNIEVQPSAVKIETAIAPGDQRRLSTQRLDEMIDALRRSADVRDACVNVVSGRGTVIDCTYGREWSDDLKHPDVRLHDSINEWITGDGKTMRRTKIQLSLDDLFGIDVESICQRAKV